MSAGTRGARAVVWGASWNTIGFLGAAAFNFVTTLIVTRQLGVEGYARYSYLLWLASIGTLGAGAGLARPVARFVAQVRGEGRASSAAPLVRRACLLATLLGLVLGPALALAAHRLHPGFATAPAALLTVMVVGGAVTGVQAAALQGGTAFRGLALVNVLSGAALCAGSVAVAVVQGGAERQFAVAVAAATLLAVLQGLLLFEHRARSGPAVQGEPLRLTPEVRDYWLGAIGLTLIEAVVWQRPEVLFLASYSSAGELGYYNAAWALANRLMLITTFVSPVLLAQVAAMRQAEDAARMQALYSNASRWLCVLATPGFLLPAALAGPVLRFLYGAAYEPAASTLGILLLGAFAATVTVAGSAVIYGTDRMGFALRSGAAAAVATLSLDYLLIPSFGARGAAVANVAGQIVAIGATLAVSLSPSGFHFPWAAALRALLAGGLAAGAARLVESAVGGFVGLLAGGLVGLAVYVACVLVSGALGSDERSQLKLFLAGLLVRPAGERP